MRRGREKLYSHTLAFFAILANEHHPAFLLFLREWVGEDDHISILEFRFEIQQATVRVDHDRLAYLAEFAAQNILTFGDYSDANKHTRTAPGCVVSDFRHNENMLG